jgi:hypothetical protein
MGGKRHTKGMQVTTILMLGLAILIILVVGGVLNIVPGLAETIERLLKGGGTLDISDTELGRALLCAHWRCKGGCDDDYVKSNSEECPCEDEWDTNGDGKICGLESKNHPIKIISREDVTVTDNWWSSEACRSTICHNTYLAKTSCVKAIYLYNGIAFDDSSSAGIQCGEKEGYTFKTCKVPSETWYVWAQLTGLADTVSTIVCQDKPSGIPTCAYECTARNADGILNDGCGLLNREDPSCSSSWDRCTYYEDIGDIYCSGDNNCYCRFRDEDCYCDTYEPNECTETGCEPSEPAKTVPCSGCDQAGCEDTCEDYEWSGGLLVDGECVCSGVPCNLHNNYEDCTDAGCRWCDECYQNWLYDDVDKRDTCIDASERCGTFSCVEDRCGAECDDDGDCSLDEVCVGDCSCVLYVCCIAKEDCINIYEGIPDGTCDPYEQYPCPY